MIILLNIRFLITSDLILIPHPLHVFSAPRNRCSGFLHSEGDLSKGMVPVLFYWCFPAEISGIYVWICDMCMHTHTYIYIHIHNYIYIHNRYMCWCHENGNLWVVSAFFGPTDSLMLEICLDPNRFSMVDLLMNVFPGGFCCLPLFEDWMQELATCLPVLDC